MPDRQSQAVEAFRVLGPIARPAIWKLAGLLESGTNFLSADCLRAIGPESVPALIHAMSSTNQNVARIAIASILEKERQDPNGLNGFLLLLHLGSGPRRTDKFHSHLGDLLDYLTTKDYQFVRIDELLERSRAEL